jgi:hypothetical protein
MNGDSNGNYYAWPYTLGEQMLTVKATNANGTVTSVFNFTVISPDDFCVRDVLATKDLGLAGA